MVPKFPLVKLVEQSLFYFPVESPSPQARQGRQGYRDYHYSDYNSGDHLEDLWHTPQGNGQGFLGKLKGLGDRQDIAGIPTPVSDQNGSFILKLTFLAIKI